MKALFRVENIILLLLIGLLVLSFVGIVTGVDNSANNVDEYVVQESKELVITKEAVLRKKKTEIELEQTLDTLEYKAEGQAQTRSTETETRARTTPAERETRVQTKSTKTETRARTKPSGQQPDLPDTKQSVLRNDGPKVDNKVVKEDASKETDVVPSIIKEIDMNAVNIIVSGSEDAWEIDASSQDPSICEVQLINDEKIRLTPHEVSTTVIELRAVHHTGDFVEFVFTCQVKESEFFEEPHLIVMPGPIQRINL